MSINLHVLPNSIIVIHNETTTIQSTDPRYMEILKTLATGMDEEAIKDIVYFRDKPKGSTLLSKITKLFKKEEKDVEKSVENTEEDVEKSVDTDKYIFDLIDKGENNTGHLDAIKPEDRISVDLSKGKVIIDEIEMPEAISIRFLDLKRRHKPRSYLVNFWDKLKKNPSQNSIQMLYRFLEHNGHPITASGDFVAYKIVRQDLMDHHSNTNKHVVGKVIKMGREKVVEDPNQLCTSGLHVCSAEYFKEFHNGDSRYLEVLVNPKDVVSVPTDYNNTKMRVCAYKVHREMKNPTDKTPQNKLLLREKEKKEKKEFKKLIKKIKGKK